MFLIDVDVFLRNQASERTFEASFLDLGIPAGVAGLFDRIGCLDRLIVVVVLAKQHEDDFFAGPTLMAACGNRGDWFSCKGYCDDP